MKLILFLLSFNVYGLEITGKAFFNNQLLYSEKHSASVNKDGFYDSLTTEYYDSTDHLFAKNIANFSKNKFIPDYVFEDFRFSLKENVVLNESAKKILISRSILGKVNNSELNIFSNSILSQGFHNYIIANLDILQSKKQEVYFIVTKKNDQYKFLIKNDKVLDGKIYISIYPSSFLLKLVLPPLKLVYNLLTKHLLTFEGLTNISDSKGDSQKAKIDYTY